MNDEFLYRLRQQPSAGFVARLKAKLNRQDAQQARKRFGSGYALLALLIGGAIALAAPAMRTTVVAFFAEHRASPTLVVRKEAPATVVAPQLSQARQPEKQPSRPAIRSLVSEWHDVPPPPEAKRSQLYVLGSWHPSMLPSPSGEGFRREARFGPPRVDRLPDAGAIRFFCQGVGVAYADAALVSHRITAPELELCEKNGVSAIIELKVGYEALALIQAPPGSFRSGISRRDLFVGLARQDPNNPNLTWRQVNPALPDEKIEVIGPAPTDATYEAFIQLMMEPGCAADPQMQALRAMDYPRYVSACRTLRDDGAYIQTDSDEDSIRRTLDLHPAALVVISPSAVKRFAGFAVLPLDGVDPSYESFVTGAYGASRPLYVYAKRAHVAIDPDLIRFLRAYASDEAIGPNSYLARDGIVPLNARERTKSRVDSVTLQTYQTSPGR